MRWRRRKRRGDGGDGLDEWFAVHGRGVLMVVGERRREEWDGK